ncbi:related to nonphototropic hypocotyl protein 1 [Phialocephala subalpina]|uniref:Related to nonphototropic hypocotyl protein 1 n=1 Tax=Phialocephala subalpina TaxID=576137 RepID=A0A1L7XM97_9HELO|nr:related to nonphototropic hypocotyl protein 1 [Phialocephala subalpina]
MSSKDTKEPKVQGWSLFPPAPGPQDEMNLAHHPRRLSPINDDLESEYGAEVRDIPLYRKNDSRPSKETKRDGRLDIPRAPHTHELVALVNDLEPPPPLTHVPLRSSRSRGTVPLNQQERAPLENQGTVQRSPSAQQHHPEERETPMSPRRLEFEDRPESSRGHRRGMPISNNIQSPASTESPRSTSRASERSSYQTNVTSLPALQSKGADDNDLLEPLDEEDLDPGSFDLVAPVDHGLKLYSLETRSEQLFSTEHLQVIFNDPSLLLRFTAFLSAHRTASIPILIYYLDAIKALKAISYSNAIAESLDPIDGFDFTKSTASKTINADLEAKSKKAFDALVREDLPAFITHTYIQTVSLSIQRRVTGTLPSSLREASEGLAEVFCLTDPSRSDNPIIFASEEFHRTTQYGMSYVLGRNCRFLQGPKTNPFSVRRIREKIEAGVEHCEVFLNYRRDGSPFMNLLMCAPLCDSRGTIRYFIGAQVDVSGLVKECSDMESLKRLVIMSEANEEANTDDGRASKDEFQELSEMLNLQELDTVRRWGGRMHKESQERDGDANRDGGNWSKPRVLITSGSPDGTKNHYSPLTRGSGRLSGIYENYLLVRPYPSLRILFASPSLRIPGILQSPFMAKIGGSNRVREELTQALADGRGVTAKVKWVSKNDLEGRNRWVHCTPLIGSNGAIGIWMIVIVDDEAATPIGRRFKMAPPVDPRFGRTVPVHHKDDGSLRDFALMNGGREGSVRGQGSIRSYGENETERSSSPYSLRIE